MKKGSKQSEEAKAKMSASRIGKPKGPMRESTKIKLSKAKKGKPLGPPSNSHKESLRQAALKRWEKESWKVPDSPKAGYSLIYRIVKESDKSSIWIGQTKRPRGRQNEHRGSTAKDDGRISLIAIEYVPDSERNQAEQDWIAMFRAAGCPLRNKAIGGPGALGTTNSEESRAKKSVALRGKKRTPEQNARNATAQRGKKMSDTARANMAAAQKGRKSPHSEATKEKLRLAAIRRMETKEGQESLKRARAARRSEKDKTDGFET